MKDIENEVAVKPQTSRRRQKQNFFSPRRESNKSPQHFKSKATEGSPKQQFEENLLAARGESPQLQVPGSEIKSFPPDAFLRQDPKKVIDVNSVMSPKLQSKEDIAAAESRTLRDFQHIIDGIKWSKSKLLLLDRKDPMEVFEEL